MLARRIQHRHLHTNVCQCSRFAGNRAASAIDISIELCITVFSKATYVVTVAHEIGHGFGSYHDTEHPDPPGNPSECSPTQPFIMYPAAQTSTNWREFSTCSKYSINKALRTIASCFVTRNAISALQEDAGEDVWYSAIEGNQVGSVLISDVSA